MIIKHLSKRAQIDETTYVAPNATICGDVKIGKNCRIMHGTALIAEGGKIEIGDSCIIFENAVIRSTPKHSARIGSNVVIGPGAHVVGCIIHDNVFVATHASIFHGAELKSGSEVRINGVVHLKTILDENETVPIGWIAVGNPAQILPPDKHEEIWAIQKELNFTDTVYGVSRDTGDSTMPQITKMLSEYLGDHFDDKVIED